MRVLKPLIAGLTSIIALSACAPAVTPPPPTRFVEVGTTIVDRSVGSTREEVFDAALIVAQSYNLNVAVLERDSGLIRFESASLTANQLDQYCEYPVVYVETGEAVASFNDWNTRSIAAYGGPVRGTVSMTFLISENGSVNVRTNLSAANRSESHPCQSTGSLERELIDDIVKAI